MKPMAPGLFFKLGTYPKLKTHLDMTGVLGLLSTYTSLLPGLFSFLTTNTLFTIPKRSELDEMLSFASLCSQNSGVIVSCPVRCSFLDPANLSEKLYLDADAWTLRPRDVSRTVKSCDSDEHLCLRGRGIYVSFLVLRLFGKLRFSYTTSRNCSESVSCCFPSLHLLR